jgi:DNA polymerase III sliding clamp (beta) subunit (PCNA family)
MQVVNVKELRAALDIASAGVAAKEIIEQSGCVVLDQNRIITYNDEVAVQVPFESGVTAVVPAEPFMALVKNCNQETVELSISDGRLLFKAKRAPSKIPITQEVLLPFDKKIKPPEKFVKLQDAEEFSKALAFVDFTVSTDTQFMEYTCVHVGSDNKGTFCESTDRYRVTRKYFSTHKHTLNILIPAVAIKILKSQMVLEIGESNGWLYFKLENDVLFACFTVEATFPDFGAPLKEAMGECVATIELPKKISTMLDRASIFSKAAETNDEQVKLTASSGKFTIRAEGKHGEHEEWCKCEYDGPDLDIGLHPQHLKAILSIATTLNIYEADIKVSGKGFFHTVRRLDATEGQGGEEQDS